MTRMRPRNPGPELPAESLYSLAWDGMRHELAAGVLLSEPPAGGEHGRVEVRIAVILERFVRAHDLGVVYADTGFLLARAPDTVRAPDVAFVSRARALALRGIATYLPLAPDLAIEIVSPNDRPMDVHAKVADYLTAGTRLVWVVDPATRTVVAYRRLLAPTRIARTGLLDGEDVLPGFRVPVADLFAES